MQIILPFYGQFGKVQVPLLTLGFQRKLAKFAISTWGKDVLNLYIIVILLSCVYVVVLGLYFVLKYCNCFHMENL